MTLPEIVGGVMLLLISAILGRLVRDVDRAEKSAAEYQREVPALTARVAALENTRESEAARLDALADKIDGIQQTLSELVGELRARREG